MGALADQLDALRAKVDEAVATVETRAQFAVDALEERVAADLAEITATIHDRLVAPAAGGGGAGGTAPDPSQAAPSPQEQPAAAASQPAPTEPPAVEQPAAPSSAPTVTWPQQ